MRSYYRHVIKKIYPTAMRTKMFNDFPLTLTYPVASHLNFFLKTKIEYESNIQRKLQSYINEGDVIFDIGGNIGQYALPFAYLTGPQGRVISFEPDPNNFAFLTANIKNNGTGNITAQQMGIGRSCSQQVLFRDTLTGGRRGSFVQEYTGETFQGETSIVEVIDYETAVQRFGIPNFVKIDVEGFEAEIIEGISYDVAGTIFLIEVRAETSARVFDFFSDRGYTCLQLDFPAPIEIKNQDMLPSFGNLLFAPKESSR